MMVDDTAAYLQTRGIGTVGVDIFKRSMPSGPDNCICLYSYPGKPPKDSHDGNGLDLPGLQVKARNKSPAAGEAKIEAVKTILHRISNQTIGDNYYLSISANQSGPVPLGADGNGRYEYTMNFSMTKRR